MAAGDPAFAPWVIGGIAIDVKCGTQGGWSAATSNCWFDLTGAAFETGELSLTFPAVIGRSYALLLNYGASSQTADPKNLYIDLDGNNVHFELEVPGINTWSLVTYSFIATATSHQLRIYSDVGFDSVGAYIDSPRLFECTEKLACWCFQSYATLGDCQSMATTVDNQMHMCGCPANSTMNGECNADTWAYSAAMTCAADDAWGSFGTCEAQSDTYSLAYEGDCVDTDTTRFGITVQTNNFVPSTLTTLYTGLVCANNSAEYLFVGCGSCQALGSNGLFYKVKCLTPELTIYLDSECKYPVAGPFAPETCAATEYEDELMFVLTVDNPEKCEKLYIGANCVEAEQRNSTDENICWSTSNLLPVGVFGTTGYQSFRINCPAKTIQFYNSATCTGPVQHSVPQTAGCYTPVVGVNISLNFDTVCGCGPNATNSSSASSTSSVQPTSQSTSASPSPSVQVTASPTPSPTPVPQLPAEACYHEYSDENCNASVYTQNLTFACNVVTPSIANDFSALLDNSSITTYVQLNCTETSGAPAYDVCFDHLSGGSGMITVGDCTSQPVQSSSAVDTSQSSIVGTSQPADSSSVIGTSQPTNASSAVETSLPTNASDTIPSIGSSSAVETSLPTESSSAANTSASTNIEPSVSGNQFYILSIFYHTSAVSIHHAPRRLAPDVAAICVGCVQMLSKLVLCVMHKQR